MRDKDKTEKQMIDELKRLRKQAEKVVQEKAADFQDIPAGGVQELIHELQVHQIELEMQNDELRRAQLELEDSRNKYYELYDFAPIGYFTLDQNGLILEANLAGADMLGIERRYLIKRAFSGFVVPAYHELFYSHRKRVLETRTHQTCDLKLHRNDGNAVYVQMESVSVQDDVEDIGQFRTTIVDITERKQMEEALQESELKFRSVAQSANDAIISSDRSGHIVFWNAAAQEMFGYMEEQAMGKPLTILMPERYRDTHQQGMERHSSTGVSNVIGNTIELEGLKKDGSEFPMELSLATWKIGEDIYYTGIVRDISERKRVEGEREKLILDLQDALANVKTLSGLLPICAACKKIRDDKGYWNQIESYIRDRSEAQFTHGLCPDCAEKIYGKIHKEEK
jgi:two-component system CheB/CheR fusion protein